MRDEDRSNVDVSNVAGTKLMNYKKRLRLRKIGDVVDVLLKLVSFEEIKTYIESNSRRKKK
ncbi:unnamed protein product [marine sediment metagenome]|uniref:Uncharacterized protein n=1 Tax=marine sediment metagenome TaxID=412755 RepID=X1SL71_9ZZZZ